MACGDFCPLAGPWTQRGIHKAPFFVSPLLAEHDRPKDVASTPSPGAVTAPRTRLGIGIVPQPYARIDGASHLRRGFLEDVLACPCAGRGHRAPSGRRPP
jgi:hypothetical protein